MTTGQLTVAVVPHTRELGLYLRRREPTEGSSPECAQLELHFKKITRGLL